MATWQVQQAKSHFSELLEKAEREGPQTITKHGAEKAVVLSVEEYRRLAGRKKDFVQHLLDFPKSDGFELPSRVPDQPRDLNLEDDESDERAP
jgi:prevent-host-death family protein